MVMCRFNRFAAVSCAMAWLIAAAPGCERSPVSGGDSPGRGETSRPAVANAGAEVIAPEGGDDGAAVAAGSGGEETWRIFRGDAGLRGVAAGSLPDEPALLWTFEAEAAIVSSPVVWDGRVYVGSDDGNLYCLDFETGEKIWSYPTEFLIEAPPLVHDGIVYVGSHDFYLHAVDAMTGEGLWKFETYEKIVGSANIIPAGMRGGDGEVGSPHPGPLPGGEGDGADEVDSPALETGDDPPAEPGANGREGGDWIVIGSHDAFVYALDAKTGEKKWEAETNDRVNGTVAIAEGKIVFGGCDTILYSVDAATGESSSLAELGGDCHIAASVAVHDGHAYLGHNANEVVSIDLSTNEIVWRYGNSRFGFFSAPAVTDDLVLVGGRDSRLHAIDRLTGEPVWAFPTRRKIDAAPVVCGDRVVVGSGDGRLYMVRLDDGSEIWSYDVGKSIYSSPAVVDGRILVGANDGRLYAFGEGATSSARETDGD